MRITKWVEIDSQEVRIDIGADDIRIALGEAFAAANQDLDRGPNQHDVLGAFNLIAGFLNGMTDEMIAALLPKQREVIEAYLTKSASRFRLETP